LALAVDASGNVWIANQSINSVSEWSNLGASYSPYTVGTIAGGFTGGGIYVPIAIAIDPSGYVWVANGNSTLSKLNDMGTADTSSPFSGGGLSTEESGMAIDGSGNVWVTNNGSPGSVSEFNARGIAQSPSTGYTDGMADPSVLAIDGSGNVWIYNQRPEIGNGEYYYVKLNNASGSLTVGVSGSYQFNPPQLAIDKSGNVWSAESAGGQVFKIPANYRGSAGTQPGGYPDTSLNKPIGDPQGIAFDGSNRLWVANAGQSGNSISPNLSLFDPSSSDVFDYVNTDFSNGPSSVAVDASGNVWVLLGNNTVTEYVGVATPVVTPLSVGVKNSKLGTKP